MCRIKQLPLYYNIIYHRLVDVMVRVHPSVKITEHCYYITLTANYTPNIFLFIRLFGVKRTQVKPEVNADAPNGWTVPAPHFAPVA